MLVNLIQLYTLALNNNIKTKYLISPSMSVTTNTLTTQQPKHPKLHQYSKSSRQPSGANARKHCPQYTKPPPYGHLLHSQQTTRKTQH